MNDGSVDATAIEVLIVAVRVIMGQKGAKLTKHATDACDALVTSLTSLGNITSRKMFGGYGVFQDSKMFALVSSEGIVYFKVTDQNLKHYQDAGSECFGRMPYYAVPESVKDDSPALLAWARDSIAVAFKP